jgi:hypothetical protein
MTALCDNRLTRMNESTGPSFGIRFAKSERNKGRQFETGGL